MPHECTRCGRVFADGSKEMLSGCPDCGGNKFQFRPAEPESTDAPATDSAPDERSTGATDPADDGRRDLSSTREWPDHGYGSDASDASDEADPAVGADPDAGAGSPSERALDADRQPNASPDPSSDDPTPPEPAAAEADADPVPDASVEDPAQASARTDVVSPDEIPSTAPEPTEPAEPAPTDAADSDRADADWSPTGADGRAADPAGDDRPDLEDLREELNEQFESIRIVAPGEYELNLMELYDRTEYIISLQEDGRYVIEVPDTWDTTPDPDES